MWGVALGWGVQASHSWKELVAMPQAGEAVAASSGRRRIEGPPVTKKITMSMTESLALEELMRRAGIKSLSELLVTSALAPDKRISRSEAEHMMATMNETRVKIGDLVLEVRRVSDSGCSTQEYEEALESFMAESKLVMDALFNSVYTLAI